MEQEQGYEMESIGVDLGGHTTTMASFKNNSLDMVLSNTQERSTPTILAYPKKKGSDERLIGQPAQFQKRRNFSNTFYFFQKFLGQKDKK